MNYITDPCCKKEHFWGCRLHVVTKLYTASVQSDQLKGT